MKEPLTEKYQAYYTPETSKIHRQTKYQSNKILEEEKRGENGLASRQLEDP